MNIFAEDGPKFMGNKIDENNVKEIEAQKANFMKYFMVDYMEFSMRRAVTNNAVECARKVGYFRNIHDDLHPQ